MTAARVDFEMRGMVATHEAIHSLKAGDKLSLQSPANSVEVQVLDAAGQQLGVVPQEIVHANSGMAGRSVTVRSVKRADGQVQNLLLRYVPGMQDAAQFEGSMGKPADENEELEGTTRLQQTKLGDLAANHEVRDVLKDTRLQEQIRKIDAAPNREKALQEALGNANFKAFTDQLWGMDDLSYVV